MKKSFALSLLLLLAAPRAAACFVEESKHNYYMFSVLDYEYTPAETDTESFWRHYSNGQVEAFDAEVLTAIAHQKGDTEMEIYVHTLDTYLSYCEMPDPWFYPTKEQLQERAEKLNAVKNTATSYRGSRLRDRYALLLMRANRALRLHQENVNYWNSTASKFPASALRNRMEGIYAGALLRTGKRPQACEVYARLGDEQSMRWCARNYCDLAGIRAFFDYDPNARMMPYLVQKFVNNAQETLDNGCLPGNEECSEWMDVLGAKTTFRADVEQFISFAEKAAANPKVQHPCLYLTAAGFLHYLYGEQQQAEALLERAEKAAGTRIMKDNLRAIRLLVSVRSAKPTDSYSNYLLRELQWLELRIDETNKKNEAMVNEDEFSSPTNHYRDVLLRVVYNNLAPFFRNNGQSALSLALINMVEDNEAEIPAYAFFYNGRYAALLDSLSADEVIAYWNLINGGARNDIQRWTANHCKKSADYYNDLIGTKLLREERWAEAVQWLTKVPLSYLNQQGIAPYAKNKDFNVERWLHRQGIPKHFDWENVRLSTNRKVDFCHAMMKAQSTFNATTDEERCETAYQVAKLYYQASREGDCWYLTQYGQSVNDTTLSYAPDFVQRTLSYLDIALQTTNRDLKERTLIARAYIHTDPWFGEAYDDDYNFYYFLRPQSRQYAALNALREFVDAAGGSRYVSRCDVLKIFRKQTASRTSGRFI